MKAILITLLMVTSVNAMSSELRLQPGSTVLVRASEPTKVICEGSAVEAESTTACTIKENGGSYKIVYAKTGDSLSNWISNLRDAVNLFKYLKEAGVCR